MHTPDVIVSEMANGPPLASTRNVVLCSWRWLGALRHDTDLGVPEPGGRLVLYTGTPIVRGADLFFDGIRGLLQLGASQFRYEEIDPDVFGEELDGPAYYEADRIAAVGLIATKRG